MNNYNSNNWRTSQRRANEQTRKNYENRMAQNNYGPQPLAANNGNWRSAEREQREQRRRNAETRKASGSSGSSSFFSWLPGFGTKKNTNKVVQVSNPLFGKTRKARKAKARKARKSSRK